MTDQTPTRTLTIAEAAAATGLSPHTLRYYERDGLLPSTPILHEFLQRARGETP